MDQVISGSSSLIREAPSLTAAEVAFEEATTAEPAPWPEGEAIPAARAVVTGGAGFIGSHLVGALVEQGYEVLVFDDFSRGKHEHLEAFFGDGKLEVVVGDLRSPEDLESISSFQPSEVYHLAALHFIPYCNAHPQETLDINVVGTDALLSTVRSLPVERFVFASSAAVYGFGERPHPETSRPRPFDIYGMSKWVGERLLHRFHRERPDIRCVSARLSNVYGPRETNPHVLPDILSSYRRGSRISLGNLWPKRDYVYVEDVAQALVASGRGAAEWQEFNVGTGVGHTVLDLVRSIETITGARIEVHQAPERMRADDGHLVLDISKISRALEWRPAHDLMAGLRDLLEWSADGGR